MKKRFLLWVIAVAVFASAAVFAVQANENADPNGVYAAAVQMTKENVLSGGTVTAKCPYCNADAQWEELTAITAVTSIKGNKHYYLSGDLNNSNYYYIYDTVCLHLNGHSITSSARGIYVETNARLNIMGDGTITGKGLAHATCDRGSAVDSAGTLNLCGGTYGHTGSFPVITCRSASGGINIYEGTRITGKSGYNGSNVRLHLSYLNVYGGVIENGIATQGGNIYGGKDVKVTIAGGTVTGGTVYMAENSASLTLTGSPKVDVINNFDGPKADISGLTKGADIQIVGQGTITKANANMATLAQYLHSPNELVKLSVTDNAVFATVDITANSTAPLSDGKTLKLLCLTSSFGLNTTELLYDIAMAEGFEEVIVGRLYASGCSLQKHVTSYKNDVGVYTYTKFTSNGKITKENTKLLEGLLEEDWDIIFIQQGAEQTPQLSTYVDYLDQLLEVVDKHKTNPNAKYIWNMTWAFQSDNPRTIFTDTFQGNQLLMHEAIVDAMQEKILTRSEFSAMIPTGAAVQSARTSYFGDRLTKDTLHLNNLGRVIGGYSVLATVLDKDFEDIHVGAVSSYDLTSPIRLSEIDRQVVMEAVNAARANPFTVNQSKYTPEFLNGISAKAEALSFTTGQPVSAQCPVCEKTVLWTPLTNTSATKLTPTEGNKGHYYLAEDLTVSDSYFYMDVPQSHAGYCLHLNGHSIRNTGKRALWIGAGNTLNIMGSGTVSGVGEGSTESDYRGASLDVNGIVNLFGGTITPIAARPAVILRTSATRVNLFDGATIQGNKDYAASLVHVRITAAEFNMFGGIVEGGKADTGGNIYITAKAFFNMFGGTVRNGYATSFGGNVYASNGTVNMYGGTIMGGKTENSSTSYGRGANVAINGTKGSTSPAFMMYGGTLGSATVTGEEAGYASAGGANLYVANGTAEILGKDALISGGYGKNIGGNVLVSTNAYITLTEGTIQNGSSARGGNVYMAGTSSNFNFNGGTVADGTATTSGGNFYVNNGYFTFAGGTSKGGTAPTGANLHLKTGKADTANFAIIHHDPAVSKTAPVITGGNVYCEHLVTLGAFSATNAPFSMATSCKLTVEEGLQVENVTFAGNLVDLAGHNGSISGTGSVTCFDSANEDFKTFGTLSLSGITLENTGLSTVADKTYYALESGNSYSFHRLDMALTRVSLRPGTAGLYYNAKWSCDPALADKIDAYGIIVSTQVMPGEDYKNTGCMWTAYDKSRFVSGEEKTSAMVDGILKNTDSARITMNSTYGRMSVFAKAYITIDGNTILSNGTADSLHSILKTIDENITQYPQYQQALKDFMTYWKNYGLTGDLWNFDFE